MARVIKLGIKRPATSPLLPDPEPRPVKYTIISVDDHLMEPPHTFAGRLPQRFAAQAPRVEETEEGHQVWVFEDTPSSQKAADFAIGAILFGLGATGTTDPGDCMCGWLTQCQASNGACTVSSSINAALSCPNQTNPQDEVAILHSFCQ